MPLACLVIAAPHSGAGKTTVSAVLAAAFTSMGLAVQPYKVGPDYIDPTHLTAAAGRTARTLDGFFLEEPELLEVFRRGALGADLALIEGVMGLFDGADAVGRVASTAQVAKLLRAPVVLVVDAAAMAGSVAALARGFRDHDPEVWLAGVIANRVGGERHAALLAEALEAAGIPWLGYLPRGAGLELPERHLGLVLAGEARLERDRLVRAARTLDLEGLLRLARAASPLPAPPHRLPTQRRAPRARIGIARDAAFGFYYPEVLEVLEQLGAELVPFSPLTDPEPPPGVGALWLGGGYPERFARELSANRGMRAAIRHFKGPIYAECGGLMYLSEALVTPEGAFPMVGLVPGAATMQARPVLGYRAVEALADSPLARRGWRLKGHEFHYSTRPPTPRPAWRQVGGTVVEGYTDGRVLASYVHLYLPAAPEAAERFVEAASGLGGGGNANP
ncbi:cobyrinate a,c-diamide synthase [Marinithermus hydrothermalis]|uniref:Cobyrinate a,c-diamide synthase n=1 Tax=Marinithermus hydrothermalis (strain DSM 14884 / JCM 11576 / T1) TaxID=869210 RepID=F2NMY6_MARHT|nr:cobyrinate a,c-diamide synthase [Marinithermus hydrothermalis]AEB12725.1 Cobyrinic acid A,C-diamide synthase [Marinithermus hydrothermalis DSM 14884]